MTDVRTRVEAALAPLVGLPLWDHHRVLDVQILHLGGKRTETARFGPRKGQTSIVGEYTLHLSCAWRIVDARGLVVGSADRLEKSEAAASIPDEEWDWNKRGANRRDECMVRWFGDNIFIVESIRVDPVGGFAMSFSGGALLEVFPDATLDTEAWRLLGAREDERHFVVRGAGIDD